MKCLTLLLATVSWLAFFFLPAVHGACSLRGNKEWFAPGTLWATRDNQLYYGDHVFRLKGINWNGMESDCRLVHGMWANTLEHYLDLLKANEFNALRIPLSFEVMEDPGLPVNLDCATADADITPGMNAGQFLAAFLDKVQSRGMFVLFDMHTIGGQITEMPWTDDVSEERVVAAWTNFAEVFGRHPAVMGLEIKNEPHGPCTTADFHQHSAKVITSIGHRYRGPYYIDGTAGSSDQAPWGGTFEHISKTCEQDALCMLGMPERIVFAPHVYGPDVRGPTVSEENDATFERRFGFLRNHTFLNRSAIIVTEFGGHMRDAKGPDYRYFERWKEYMDRVNLTSGAFFWTFPPSSGDTGGILLDDWNTVDVQKLNFLKQFQPLPSKFLC